jgi:hypothetical protein
LIFSFFLLVADLLRTNANLISLDRPSPSTVIAIYLGSQVKVDVPLLKLKGDQQWYLVAHVQDDMTRERGRLGKVLKVFEGKGQGHGLLKDDADAVLFLALGHLGLRVGVDDGG